MGISNRRLRILILSGLFCFTSPHSATALAGDVGGIDVHAHLAPDRAAGLRGFDASVDTLIAAMDRKGVAKALVMPPPQTAGMRGGYVAERFLSAIQRYPGRIFWAAGGGELMPIILETQAEAVTPSLRARFRKIAETAVSQGAKAFGEMAALHFSFSERHAFEQVEADHPLFLLLADIAAEKSVPIDLHVEVVQAEQDLPKGLRGRSSLNPSRVQATLPALERLLRHNPKAQIVWQHAGWDNTGQMSTALLDQMLENHPNLHLALKYVGPELEPFQAGPGIATKQLTIRAEWLSLIRKYPDRFVVGSDEFFIPRSSQGSRRGPPPSFDDTWTILNNLPPEIRDKVVRTNAERIYRL